MSERVTKYLEINNQFNGRVSEIRIALKVSNRTCEAIAVYLRGEKPKTQQEFERSEKLKNYVIKTSELNDKVLDLIEYTSKLLIDVAEDSVALTDGANLLSTLEFQSDTIKVITEQRETATKELYEFRKDQINSK